jgi:aryl-alcohol dehydrogenase-like predicted oxidoreductase
MIYRRIGSSEVEVSIVGLGGHEYLRDGRSRGFNELPELSVKPGYVMDGFGQERRKDLLRFCYEQGINLFDTTIDSEKEALGRNLQELPPPYPVYVQTRPEGLVYNRDPYNQGMARYEVLQAEVQRGLGLLRRDRLDSLNIAFMKPALDHDPAYLDKIGDNIRRLKAEGLIRFACLDTFSGEWTYLQGIQAGCFDAMFINFNLANDEALRAVFPAAREAGMAVLVRECFMKGELFHMGDEVGLADRSRLAQTALKWCLTREGVTAAMVGSHDRAQMASNLRVLEDLGWSQEDQEIVDHLRTSTRFQQYRESRRHGFLEIA